MGEPGIPQGRLRRWLALGLLTATHPSRRRVFIRCYGSLEAAVSRGESAWHRAGLLRRPDCKDIFRRASRRVVPEVKLTLDDTGALVRRQLRRASREGATILCMEDRRYPERLRESPDPPPVLFLKGDPEALLAPMVALVGARRPTPYGRALARRMASDLVASGMTVVSGGARGIDSEGHRGALESGGPTVAVTGSGLDWPYPRENRSLFAEIAERGAVVSEFPFGWAPLPRNFPMRNRVIAALSAGVVVVEGREGSGSLITASCALDAGRDVLAAPGPVGSPLSEGPNRLIREGAALVRNGEDIMNEMPLWALDEAASRRPAAMEAGEELPEAGQRILEAIDPVRGSTADELAEALETGAGELLGRLMELELNGWIGQVPGGRFVRRN